MRILIMFRLLRIIRIQSMNSRLLRLQLAITGEDARPSEQFIDKLILRIIDGDVDNDRHLLGQGVPEHGFEIIH